jgi:hypothetical protein
MSEREDAERESAAPDELAARSAAGRERSHRLARQVSQAAASVADTEERVADQLDRISAGTAERAGRLREQADRARSFARHERAEQRRWARVAEGDQR